MEWAKVLFIAFAAAGSIQFFFFVPIVVDGESMMPMLKNGDRMIAIKIGYLVGEPDRLDIVVFHVSENKDYIKRVIGISGDQIVYENDKLYINGEIQDEPYLTSLKAIQETGISLTEDFSLEELTEVQVIPEGHVFVLGDNRRNSTDSRIIGLVPIDSIVGSTKYVFWPYSDIGIVE
ncbi:type I signal peptidase [Planomicrobium soli]|uniref:Signal peptidase I n=1 Tax=Planomicrobium soli TaxID=1176648 RepID=A0A2P8GGA1_9BACL|nr:signal peptidase I [Planomicrobium soli]PSL32960.1 type I signal peptidase [Planomicrobium soli]